MKAVMIWILEKRIKALSIKKSKLNDIYFDAINRDSERKAINVFEEIAAIRIKLDALEAKLAKAKGD
jgi:hypothetical protein